MKFLDPNTRNRILRWGVLIFFCYIVFRTFSTPQPLVPESKVSSASHTVDCTDKNRVSLQDEIPFFSIPLIPRLTPELNTQDIEQGTGETAHCGQHVELRYSYASKMGIEIFSNLKGKAITQATLGDGTLLRGLDLGLEGMQAGGTRRIVMSPQYGFRTPAQVAQMKDNAHFVWKEKTPIAQQEIVATATLLGVTPATPVSPMPAQAINKRLGSGDEVLCADTVKLHISVWSVEGQKIFSTVGAQPLMVTLGHSDLPYGIEQAILGMREGSERTVILPPALQAPLEPSKTPALVTLAGKETVLVEISVLSKLEPTTPAKQQ